MSGTERCFVFLVVGWSRKVGRLLDWKMRSCCLSHFGRDREFELRDPGGVGVVLWLRR